MFLQTRNLGLLHISQQAKSRIFDKKFHFTTAAAMKIVSCVADQQEGVDLRLVSFQEKM